MQTAACKSNLHGMCAVVLNIYVTRREEGRFLLPKKKKLLFCSVFIGVFDVLFVQEFVGLRSKNENYPSFHAIYVHLMTGKWGKLGSNSTI